MTKSYTCGILNQEFLLYRTNNIYLCLLSTNNFKQLCRGKERLLGVGVPGCVVASHASFYLGRNINFVRKVTKTYGCKKRIEGPEIEKEKNYFVWAESDPNLQEIISSYRSFPIHIKEGNLNLYINLNRTSFNTHFSKDAGLSYCNLINVKKRIIKLKGKFILSSGKESTYYFDVIPALTQYRSLITICNVFSKIPLGDVIVGPPYGGISFAVFLGLYSRRPVLIPIQTKDFSRLKFSKVVSNKTCTIVDDFTSTGKTSKETMKGLEQMGFEIKNVCSLVVANKDLRIEDIPIFSLFYINQDFLISFNEELNRDKLNGWKR